MASAGTCAKRASVSRMALSRLSKLLSSFLLVAIIECLMTLSEPSIAHDPTGGKAILLDESERRTRAEVSNARAGAMKACTVEMTNS
jgi:hypothetical protein